VKIVEMRWKCRILFHFEITYGRKIEISVFNFFKKRYLDTFMRQNRHYGVSIHIFIMKVEDPIYKQITMYGIVIGLL